MTNAQIILILLGLYYINNNASYDYIKYSDDVAELLNHTSDATLPRFMPPAVQNNFTVENVKQILLESYKIKNAAESIKRINIGHGYNKLDKDSFKDIICCLEPFMNDNERQRCTQINAVIDNVGRASKGISKISSINSGLSGKQSTKEKAGYLYEVLSPFIDASVLNEAKKISDLIAVLNYRSEYSKNNTESEDEITLFDDDEEKQKNQIMDILESIENKRKE